MMRPNSGLLLNSQAFALANLGRLAEAEQSLKGIAEEDLFAWLVSKANHGLIAMRRGEQQSATLLYREAIDAFHKHKMETSADFARLYFAREAALAKLPQAQELIDRGRTIVGNRNLASFSQIGRASCREKGCTYV